LLTDTVNFTKREGPRVVSSVIGGKFKFEGVGEEVKVGEGTVVVLSDLENVTLRTFAVEKGIHCTLHGIVGKLLTGTEGNTRNRNPVLLEWVAARHTWILYVQALMVIVPLFLGLLRWWKGSLGGG
jgi:hypothetical protein